VAARRRAADLLRWDRLREAVAPGTLAEAFQRAREARLSLTLDPFAREPCTRVALPLSGRRFQAGQARSIFRSGTGGGEG
jgi:hypothetical protein